MLWRAFLSTVGLGQLSRGIPLCTNMDGPYGSSFSLDLLLQLINRRRIKTMFGVHLAPCRPPTNRPTSDALWRCCVTTGRHLILNQLGPPLIRGTMFCGWSHQTTVERSATPTHSAPSRCKIRARRAARFRWGLGCLDEALSPEHSVS